MIKIVLTKMLMSIVTVRAILGKRSEMKGRPGTVTYIYKNDKIWPKNEEFKIEVHASVPLKHINLFEAKYQCIGDQWETPSGTILDLDSFRMPHLHPDSRWAELSVDCVE